MGQAYVREYKYFDHSYLAQSFSELTRQRCFAFHEAFILTALHANLIPDFLKRGMRLHEFYVNENLFSVTLGPTPEHRREGELSLVFEVNNHAVYVLSFSVVAGQIVGLDEAEVLLIARMQGFKGAFAGIREATKALSDVSPQAALVAAVDGIARALSIGRVVGVAGANNCSYINQRPLEPFLRAYDEFYVSLGAERLSDGFFQMPVPFSRKPLQAAKPGHRLRTKRKQELKEKIAESVCRTLRAALDEQFMLQRAGVTRLDSVRQADLRRHLAQVNLENRDLKNRLEAFERDRAELPSSPPKLLQRLLDSRFAFVRHIAERLEARRLKASRFDAQYYLERNRDVTISGRRAALHYVRRGRDQRRDARLAVQGEAGQRG